ncbi:hypothetical protein R3P38DRAFT_3287684 [Favolaschia claudopus]|uniref:Uncharacterized protein n=1 Tax=Favolaschia claudopus TaxID=2862362 RepID=A0AAW0A0L9_9AGAR
MYRRSVAGEFQLDLQLKTPHLFIRPPAIRLQLSTHSKFLRCAALLINNQPQSENSIFVRPPSDASTFLSALQKFLFPLRGALRHHQHQAPKSKFEISRSRDRGIELLDLQFFFLPLRGALRTMNLVKFVKSAKLKKNFFAARLSW